LVTLESAWESFDEAKTSVRDGYALRVFLCHSSEDKPEVRDLFHRLKGDGFAPWLDEQELLPGQSWQEEIPVAVRACEVIIVCLSRNSITKDGLVQKEIEIALDAAEKKPEGTISIIPVRLEEVDVPKRLSQWQSGNLFQEGGYERLILAIRKRMNTVEDAAHSTSEEIERAINPSLATVGKRSVFSRLRPVIWITSVLLGIGGLGLSIYHAKTVAEYRSLEQRAETGDAHAMLGLARMLVQGRGVSQNYGLALQWYMKAANADTVADAEKAFDWYMKAAAIGSSEAMTSIGVMYQHGEGVPYDSHQAFDWYMKAAVKGDIRAMVSLGSLYQQGEGVALDYQQALDWYEKAAKAGDGEAMFNLGLMYQQGQGVIPDTQKARAWFEKAKQTDNAYVRAEADERLHALSR
jgi:TPR repeat protein